MAGCTISLGSGTAFAFAAVRSTNTHRPSSPSLQLGFLNSQLSGLKISSQTSLNLPTRIVASPFQPIVARRVCPFTGKKANRANKVSFSNHKTKKLQFVNLQYKRVWWEAGKRYVKLRLSTKALKTIEKNGLDAVAKKAGIDLRKK
ncbi:large ribosomal subunit protein bL28c [Cicer arietinum]|uniref:Large ribosomal subunit protein bL28c n=1 Tax=Cicer arietinum TaxID=3827 RepID=A0A1S2Y3L3_CICAR|nr:50S ribosomal protein L28, chloroplastic [Cicer arietinum]